MPLNSFANTRRARATDCRVGNVSPRRRCPSRPRWVPLRDCMCALYVSSRKRVRRPTRCASGDAAMNAGSAQGQAKSTLFAAERLLWHPTTRPRTAAGAADGGSGVTALPSPTHLTANDARAGRRVRRITGCAPTAPRCVTLTDLRSQRAESAEHLRRSQISSHLSVPHRNRSCLGARSCRW